jgi:vancomycin resistance protein YoaR
MSNLTKEEATKKLIDNLVKELNVNINLKYEDLVEECSSEDITFRYDVPKAIELAYSVGRNDNIFMANYDVVKAYLMGDNVQVEYNYDKDKAVSKIKSLQSKITNSVVEPAYEIDGATLVVSKGKDGLAINLDQVKDEIVNNIIGRNYNEIKESQEPYTITVNTYQKQADKIDMQKIGEAIYTEPVNAIYVKEPFSLTKEKNGVKLAISAEEAQAQVDGQDKQEYSFPLTITKPEITINDIGLEAFPYKISTFSTNYDASNVSRTNNLKIASNKTNNVVIMPGEVFSFNQVVGKRTVEEGYKDAKVYENGRVVDGLAGGICQVSSTMYDAALLANLEIVERYNHQFTTSYLPGGKDATVVYGIKDFKFRNSRKYPIKIVTSMGGGTITYSIYGIQEENEYTVVITPVITSRIAGRTITEVDKSLAPGKSVTVQAGHSGQRVTTYKELWQNGTKISSEVITNDVYNAMDTIVHVGPAAPAPAPAPATPTPAPTTPQQSQTTQTQQQNKPN